MENRYLYRGKRIDTGEWVYGLPSCDEDGEIEEIEVWSEDDINFYSVDPSTVCQCTGLWDRKGKLIWENDIINGSIKRGAAFYRCLVLWNECKARFDVRAMDCNFPMTLDECTDDISMSGFDYEVVGNIFDNPELLEVQE
ncbi:MAG: YopX family protein [Roseburia sp.]